MLTNRISYFIASFIRWWIVRRPGFFIGYFFKTQGRQNSTFFKTQAIFLQNSRKISQNSIFRKFLSLWAFFKYSQWSKNEVILTILLHNIECTALTSQSFYSVSAKLNRNSTFFKNSRYFSWKLKKISAQNSIIFAKLNFSEIPFPYDGAKTAKKKPEIGATTKLEEISKMF